MHTTHCDSGLIAPEHTQPQNSTQYNPPDHLQDAFESLLADLKCTATMSMKEYIY